MPRKSQTAMQSALATLPKVLPRTRDEKAERAMEVGRRRFLRLAAQDVDFWYGQMKALASGPTTKDDAPRVTLCLAVLRTFASEQRHHDPGRQVDLGAVGAMIGSMTVHVHNNEGPPLERGTVAAREAAIELERETRARLEGGEGGGGPAVVHGSPVDSPVAQ